MWQVTRCLQKLSVQEPLISFVQLLGLGLGLRSAFGQGRREVFQRLFEVEIYSIAR